VKKYLLTIVCLLAPFALTPKSVHAQETASEQDHATRSWPSPEEVVAKLDSKLSLSDDQKAKITPIIADRQQKIRALASEGGRRRKNAREVKSIMSESDEKIKAVLTDDQRKKYAEIQQEMRQEAKERRQARRAGS
jgi:protein CpxP